MKTMTWTKAICALGVGVAALVVGAAVRMATSKTGGGQGVTEMSQRGAGDKLTAQEIAEKSRHAYAALSSYSDTGTQVAEMAGHQSAVTFSTRLQRPNLYRIDWMHGTGLKGVVWSDGSGDYLLTAAAGQEKSAKPQKMQGMKNALTLASGFSASAASMIPAAFFDQDFGDDLFARLTSGGCPLNRENDARVGEVDCYVLSGVMDLSKSPGKGKAGTESVMLCIGKSDFLIHQFRATYVEKVESSAPPSDQAVDEASRKALQMQNKPATPEAIEAMRPQMRAVMKQVQSTLKSGFESGVVFTQTREHIVVDEKFTPADFTR